MLHLLFVLAAGALSPLQLGKVEFQVGTNLKVINVHGVAEDLNGMIDFANGKISKLEVTIPIEKLSTGMKIRDSHMRDRVFKTADGKLPALQLVAENVNCEVGEDGYQCPLQASLSIRNEKQAFRSLVNIQKSGENFRLSGQGDVFLSNYQIERPSQLGAKVNDRVEVRFEVIF